MKKTGISFSDENYSIVEKYAEQNNISVSKAVNILLSTHNEKKLQIVEDSIKQNKELINSQKNLSFEINKIGNNINQIAYVLNYAKKNRKLHYELIKHMEFYLKKVHESILQLKEKVIK